MQICIKTDLLKNYRLFFPKLFPVINCRTEEFFTGRTGKLPPGDSARVPPGYSSCQSLMRTSTVAAPL